MRTGSLQVTAPAVPADVRRSLRMACLWLRPWRVVIGSPAAAIARTARWPACTVVTSGRRDAGAWRYARLAPGGFRPGRRLCRKHGARGAPGAVHVVLVVRRGSKCTTRSRLSMCSPWRRRRWRRAQRTVHSGEMKSDVTAWTEGRLRERATSRSTLWSTVAETSMHCWPLGVASRM
jgi:hypothetical protein